jgi:nicotinate-nucleotide adenylyltransferase
LRLGLYGGTFDPIHAAHCAVAREAARAFALDRVLVIPNANPPHKAAVERTAYTHRLRMIELALAGDPLLEASRLEEGTRHSYTVETLARVRATVLQPGDGLFFIIGADAFHEIGTWYRKSEVFTLTEFIVVARPGFDYQVPEGAVAHRLDSLHLELSSTELRARLARGDAPEEIDPQVLAYIREQGLYRR